MPKENKHARGRRDTLKRKREENTDREEDHDNDSQDLKKRRSSQIEDEVSFTGPDNDKSLSSFPAATGTNAIEVADRPYYGLLEDEEQEYFRRADELLELNDFPSDEERSLFLANVYREAKGKELKIACSQSCSRLMERLILLSTPQQKKKLFSQFAGNFPHLVSHRFASHCCETLFIQSASIVTEELTGEEKKDEMKVAEVKADAEDGAEGKEDEITESMESLFLATLDELEGQLSSLLTDRFASHTLRVLLIILSGRPLEKSSTKSLLQSKKKEKVGINGLDTAPTEFSLNKRTVPESFLWAIEKIISDTIASMDRAFIQVLVGHPTGNPCLQLLLELELTNPSSKKGGNSEQKTLISTLLPDDITVEGSQSAIFVNGIVYDQIGSRVLETIMTHSPGKLFKQIYRAIFKDRIAGLARNEIASYVVIRVLNRLSKEDLEEAITEISPQIEGLVGRQRTNIIKVLLERCQVRRASTEALTKSIADAYGSDKNELILKMADISLETLTLATAPPPAAADDDKPAPVPVLPKPSPSQLHGSLLAQAMLKIPGPPAQLIQNSLLALPTSTILALSLYPTTTHIIQASLLPSPPNTPSNLLFRRKLINSIISPSAGATPTPQPPIITLSLSSAGTHILDSLLHTTTTPTSTSSASLFSLCERIAMSLMPYEPLLRDSWTGRIVWRNWSMDLFKRRRADWVKRVKSGDTQGKSNIQSQMVLKSQDGNANAVVGKEILGDGIGKPHGKGKGGEKEIGGERQKSAIELAREKFAAQKLAGGKIKTLPPKGFRATGANAI
ncbi:putative rrna processing protein [Botrytis fragariae]|uniref:Nucleolar protein 9 n=1 Tax=Botrytis fragariae TaxID=1964551 RepID=A0A8H6ELM6_9HELO|nr:putative rrna processing protein [Botrytis fragariae]KAF5876797.1 putative rrna processing protein [Botrytis fragariae]